MKCKKLESTSLKPLTKKKKRKKEKREGWISEFTTFLEPTLELISLGKSQNRQLPAGRDKTRAYLRHP